MIPLVVTAGTVVSAAGIGMAQSAAALQERRTGLVREAFAGIDCGAIGNVQGIDVHALPAELRAFECRNNRLAERAIGCDGFEDAVRAAREAYGADRVAVILGTSTSGILSAEDAYAARSDQTDALPSSFNQPLTQDLFSLPRYVAARLGLKGPLLTVSNACASSSRAFVDARHWLEAGLCDAVVVGGADSLCRTTLRGFASLGLISPGVTRPCDAARDGISVGEGAGFMLLEREGARAGVEPLMRWVGYGASSDGHHMSSPDPQARGAIAAMREALDHAGLAASAIDYVNLHGTGTPANDAMEDRAVHAVFGQDVPCASTKGWTGHTLGASGAIEAMFCALMMRGGFLAGCLNIGAIDPAFQALTMTTNIGRQARYMMSNAFGFGGTNCSLIFEAA